jgi:coiled-coil domain-containing protein 102
LFSFSREKTQLHRTIDRLSEEVQQIKDKCEELRQARQDAVRELLTLQDQHKEEVKIIRADLQDESNSREGMDRRINDLRMEVEQCLYMNF